jgi:hypothetical protein
MKIMTTKNLRTLTIVNVALAATIASSMSVVTCERCDCSMETGFAVKEGSVYPEQSTFNSVRWYYTVGASGAPGNPISNAAGPLYYGDGASDCAGTATTSTGQDILQAVFTEDVVGCRILTPEAHANFKYPAQGAPPPSASISSFIRRACVPG